MEEYLDTRVPWNCEHLQSTYPQLGSSMEHEWFGS